MRRPEESTGITPGKRSAKDEDVPGIYVFRLFRSRAKTLRHRKTQAQIYEIAPNELLPGVVSGWPAGMRGPPLRDRRGPSQRPCEKNGFGALEGCSQGAGRLTCGQRGARYNRSAHSARPVNDLNSQMRRSAPKEVGGVDMSREGKRDGRKAANEHRASDSECLACDQS